MSRGTGEEGDIIFFSIGCCVSDDDLEKEYESRGLVPADPYSLIQVNIDDPSFADKHPNCTHWKDENGKWYYIAFNLCRSKRYVRGDCYNDDPDRDDWDGDWWFAGRRKVSTQT